MSSNEPVRNGCEAQLVRASHRYREVTGSNPVEVLTFSRKARKARLFFLRPFKFSIYGFVLAVSVVDAETP